MELTRRNVLITGTAAFAATGLGAMPAFASKTDEAITAFTGGAEVGEGVVTLDTPEIAENGNTVPVAVSAPGAVSVMLLADGNPRPEVATFNFGALNPSRTASTRIRLAGTQSIVAVAKMEDGSFQKAMSEVKVTIGGCGG